MPHYNLALMGFGNVGRALAGLLISKRGELASKYNLSFAVTAIATKRHGVVINENGIDLEKALRVEDLSALEDSAAKSLDIAAGDGCDFICRCGADVLFENTPVNYETGQPALDCIRAALNCGMYAVTANKGPVVFAYEELTQLAESHGRKFYFESAVMDGAPVFAVFRETLPAANLISFKGVLNSTTNVILTRMENGDTFDEAVGYTQSIGLAETDPSGDIDGWDAAIKVAALVTVLMGKSIKPVDIEREGIREITPEKIESAKRKDKRWKLICSAYQNGNDIQTKVEPQMVGPETPFYAIAGSTSIVQFETDTLHELSIIEGNPGPDTTAYGLLADFINAVK